MVIPFSFKDRNKFLGKAIRFKAMCFGNINRAYIITDCDLHFVWTSANSDSISYADLFLMYILDKDDSICGKNMEE